MKKRVRYILLVLVSLCILGYMRYAYLDRQASQKKVIHKFINTFYDLDYSGEAIGEEQTKQVLKEVLPLLSADYEIEPYDLTWLEMSPTDWEDNIEYAGYTISNIIKAKNNEKKVTVYIVDVEFMENEKIKTGKSLFIELTKENSQWKINKLMPCSA